MSLRVFSSGGGQQSIAALVLSATGAIDFPLHVFANTGDDSENPRTLAYVRDIAMPYAAEHGIEFVERRRIVRGEGERTLLHEIRTQPRSIPIPARMGDSYGNKRCTDRFKIAVVRKECRRRGASEDDPAVVAIGISTDELTRAKSPGLDPRDRTRYVVYPLLSLGLSRRDCQRIVADAGLPIPPKSACKFCPLHNMGDWHELRREQPESWAVAVEVDGIVRERAVALGRGAMGLASATVALADAEANDLTLFGGECDTGSCMT